MQGHHEQPGSKIIDEIFETIYFSGNWNRGFYSPNLENDDNKSEYKQKKDLQKQFYRPLTVFGDDEMFYLVESQKKQNREQRTFYSKLEFHNTPYPLPSQRLKRLLYPFKNFKHIEQQNPNFKKQLETVNNDEQEYYSRIRQKASKLKKLYTEITKIQTNDNNNIEIQKQKREFWYKLQYELGEQNVGVVSEHNIPPWITSGWYGDCALARNRNLRMPQYKPKTFQSFYPKTARWDRIMRGCYELDWNDEDYIMDIIKNDNPEKYKTPLELILSLRRIKLFTDDNQSNFTQFKPFARDPFIHIYEFYNVQDIVKIGIDGCNNIYNRIRNLYWTITQMWYLGSRFDVDGCLRVPALINPIEWQYALTLKLIWDSIKFFGYVSKLHSCSEKHCGIKDPGNRTMQYLKKLIYAFDFNEKQIYDFRYIEYLLRHTLFNQLFHVLSKHGGKYQLKIFSLQKKQEKFSIEMAHHDEYRFILDYFRFLIICNNMYEFFSPSQMGKLWEYISGTFEELRMIYPEISINTIENEYCDLIETHRHISVTKTMTCKSYQYYFGNKYFTNKEKNIWQDARGVIKQYCIKNTLFPIPDIFEGVYNAHNVKFEHNPNLVDVKTLTDIDNKKYKRKKLEKFIEGIITNAIKIPIAFYLTEIKYPYLINLIRACIKYEFPEFVQLLMNHSITSSIQTIAQNPTSDNNKKDNPFSSNVEYHNLNKSQKRYLETKFSWPYILFIEYISFNPRQFHREHVCHIVEETNHLKSAIQSESGNTGNPKSQRKILSYTNRVKLQKQRFDAWQKAAINDTIPIYPLAALLRFAVCERTNSKLSQDDELIKEGTDFTITQSVITALQTILKYPQFATRILINTHNLKELVNDITYNEFKNIYAAIFKYNAKYQEHPQMYELFKSKWMDYAKQIKNLVDVYHEPQHKLHREVVNISLDFYKYHQKCYSNSNDITQRDNLFNYYSTTHFQNMFEKHKLEIQQQQKSYIDDVNYTFKLLGYQDDDQQQRFYGNYYRFFIEREEGDDDDDDDHDDDSSYESKSDASQGSQSQEQESNDEENSNEDGDDDDDEVGKRKQTKADDDDDEGSFVDTSDDDDDDDDDDDEDEDEDDSEEDEEEIEDKMINEEEIRPKHRRMDTETQERNQFAAQLDLQDIGTEDNPLDHIHSDSSDDEVTLEKPRQQQPKKPDNLDDFEEFDDDEFAQNTKARGSNEFDAEDVKKINSIKPQTPSNLQNINEEDIDEDDGGNPFGAPMDAVDENEKKKTDSSQNNQQSQQNGGGGGGGDNNNDGGNDRGDEEEYQDNAGAFGGGAGGDGRDDDGDDDDENKKRKKDDGDEQEQEEEDEDEEEEEDMDETDGLGTLPMNNQGRKGRTKKHRKEGSDIIASLVEELEEQHIDIESEQISLAKEYKTGKTPDSGSDSDDVNVNVGNTVRQLNKKGASRRNALFVNEEIDKGSSDDDDSNDDDDDLENEQGEFRANKQWANTLLHNPNIVGMQSRDAMLQRMDEQQELYKRQQVIRLKEDEQENIYSILDLENTEFIDSCLGLDGNNINKQVQQQEFGWKTEDALVPDVEDIIEKGENIDDDMYDENGNLIDMNAMSQQRQQQLQNVKQFSDEDFFKTKNARWSDVGKTDPISSINRDIAENSYVMLKDLTEPLQLSHLLGDFQKAGQIMLSRIDDMQASLIVENKLHSGVLKAHQLDEKKCYEEKEELLNSIEKLEAELKLLRDKRDENKSETAALKTKQESYILKYNELKEISTQKLRDQLRCFEIYKAQTSQLEKRIHDVEYQTEIAFKRRNRLQIFKKQQQLNISQLDIEIESMEKEKITLQSELLNLENEQEEIDKNEKQYVERLKEQLRRLGKGMENKEKSCNIFRRNVVEERLRIHTIDDSLKKLRTNANPTTTSDQELINATQHEALQAREKYAEKTQQQSFLTNINQHEQNLINSIEALQVMDDKIYAKKWNIIQKSWNLKKHLLETGKLIQMKKYLLKKEKQSKKHKKKLSKAHFRKDSLKNLSFGASQQFKKQSADFGAY